MNVYEKFPLRDWRGNAIAPGARIAYIVRKSATVTWHEAVVVAVRPEEGEYVGADGKLCDPPPRIAVRIVRSSDGDDTRRHGVVVLHQPRNIIVLAK